MSNPCENQGWEEIRINLAVHSCEALMFQRSVAGSAPTVSDNESLQDKAMVLTTTVGGSIGERGLIRE